ncbi:hypothetical protein [Paenibacillus polymyxa]|uniref:hypothetical protein n=1 Tax=Paenibacillus polymyxa TaxID=1406 RepID=UPI00287F98CE|nr:hypothetical protein [Paenibacillus polymyxa]
MEKECRQSGAQLERIFRREDLTALKASSEGLRGLIVLGHFSSEEVERMLELPIPCVFLDHPVERTGADYVVIDLAHAAADALEPEPEERRTGNRYGAGHLLVPWRAKYWRHRAVGRVHQLR